MQNQHTRELIILFVLRFRSDLTPLCVDSAVLTFPGFLILLFNVSSLICEKFLKE